MPQNDSTPFSFHCMICFEEFHPDDRYPVVLPCGHTYVCNCCANRLDRCMECRTPLYELVPHPKPPKLSTSNSSPSWSSARTGHRPSPTISRYNTPDHDPPPQPPMKRRLALPKNVVLLSLIQATELASKDARQKYAESPRRSGDSDEADVSNMMTNHHMSSGPSIPDLQSRGSMLDFDDEEEERIKMSTSLAVGMAGTYAVAVREGLQIFPSRPNSFKNTTETVFQEEDVDNLVRVYHLDQANSSREDDEDKVHTNRPMEEQSMSEKIRATKDPLKLCYGDRIQVVSIDGGWAKLARGYGFVRAERNHLVKVGGAVDRACKVEALLCSLSNRRKQLRMEQSKIDNQFIRYINELQHSLQNDEDLTVILADTFSAPVSAMSTDVATIEKEEKTSNADDYPQKPIQRSVTPPLDSSQATRFACFAGGVFGGSGDNTDESTDRLRFSFSNDFLRGSQDADPEASRLFPVTTNPSPSAMRAGAQAWRELHIGTPVTDSSINFRTGMSGHMALLSTHAHAHEYLEPSWLQHRQSTSRMSSHTGLTMPRMPTLQGILNSLTLPLMSPSPSESTRNQIPHSGSM